VITDGVEPSLHVEYKSSHVKQYFKEHRALRTETTINNPKDFYVAKAAANLTHLRLLGDQVNRKVLEVERVSQQCVLTQDALEPAAAADRRARATHVRAPLRRPARHGVAPRADRLHPLAAGLPESHLTPAGRRAPGSPV
jgi:hypothetical protein